jgi:hypothetical protein
MPSRCSEPPDSTPRAPCGALCYGVERMTAEERAAEIARHMAEAKKFDRQAARGFSNAHSYAIWHRAEARKLREQAAAERAPNV